MKDWILIQEEGYKGSRRICSNKYSREEGKRVKFTKALDARRTRKSKRNILLI
jgi:hypothetical protein